MKATNITHGGAIQRTDTDRMYEHAVRYYEEIRKRKSDIKAISDNTDFSVEEIAIVKNHLFFNKYDLGDEELTGFDPDYDIAVSWQRLIDGKNIQEMDIVLLKHELLEYHIMEEKGLSYNDAHTIACKKYDYPKYVKELDRNEGII
jgi:hypothetical protein